MRADRTRIAVLAALSMVAFAGNSLLCRVALREGVIDPASFTTVRFTSGAIALLIVSLVRDRQVARDPGAWASAITLLVYAYPFSYAYAELSAGTGALILFGCVQVTMVVAALVNGERAGAAQWLGLTSAILGLVYLVLPSLSTPSLIPAILMAIAGVCWGLYSWQGRSAPNPLAVTTTTFLLITPALLIVSIATRGSFHVAPAGVALAMLSGVVASGFGYVLWYAALRGMSGIQAGAVQLSVPVLAAAGGVLFLHESLSVRLAVAAAAVLGGIALTIVARQAASPVRERLPL